MKNEKKNKKKKFQSNPLNKKMKINFLVKFMIKVQFLKE